MKTFYLWFAKSTKNKIIAFGIIFLLSFCYVFLHRPLGLVIFSIDQQSYSHNAYNLDEIRNNISNKDMFLSLVNEYNLSDKEKFHKKELLNYIDNLNTDLFIVNAFGLNEWYYQGLLMKARIYANEKGMYVAYKAHKEIVITKNDLISMLDFLNIFNNIVSFFNNLNSKDSSYNRYMIQSNITQFLLIQPEIYFLAFRDNKLCLVVDSQIKNALLERLSSIKKVLLQPYNELDMKRLDTFIIKPINELKEQLNDCR